ncbi:helix-turn-helix domain-containing protein [Streptomyces subrutilus]|uniref:Helix-turn-helix domain-containing protein n=1 Tax=Streptomyces subrutilus TaxID=36818 RepID=A0A5P2UFK3_9ACTN|nr:helix-turn-helix domain-containing protein [Streptomyces subrutilus]QEU77219.1 helix-turn-helix domain-containing protein [Streptomyces subrutilus]WSJ33803.1 helix-turn-helix domain-containing protein [Streptomyces subrutilus]GGZ45645.1 XRE family transcriptional regulator [Streptomyces subrutilus]
MNSTAAVAAATLPAPETSRLGGLIRTHRLRIGLTQRELADLSTISVRAIRDLEQGKARRPRPDTVRLMADALRLGPRARAALEAAAQQGRATGAGWEQPPAPPTALHPIVGRDAEAAALETELSSGAERLVHLVGLTGVGKTRLALAVAERLHAAGMPVLWYTSPGATADHLGCAEGELTARTAAAVAQVQGPAAAGADGGAVDALAELLGEQSALLVLDGAPAGPVRFDRLTGLLRACPGLRLLVTSDQPWEVPGERIFLLAPLEVPAVGVADAAAPSVRLFLDHVRRVRPESTATAADREYAARVCRRLDGHPGALAAAASWLVVCDLAALWQGLDEDPVALLDHLGGRAGSDGFRGALHRRLERLSAPARGLLEALCGRAGDEFELAGITGLTGSGLAESGRMLRELLLSGAVRTAHEGGGSRFRVLGLVRAACGAPPTATAGATAGATAATAAAAS